MSLPKISVEGVSIVLLGSFNPAIFQPAWFAAQKIIPHAEAEEAEADVFRGELSQFSLDWMSVQVLRDRFMATTTQSPSFELLRDLVVGTFSILEHTPITMLGINSERHYDMRTENEWHAIGKRLAPPGPWESSLEQPRMSSLTMQGARSDGMKGTIRIKVEPSSKITFGVYVSVNDHYDLRLEEKDAVNADVAVRVIQDHWAAFLELPDAVTNNIFEASK